MRRSDKLIYLSFFPHSFFQDDFPLCHRYILWSEVENSRALDQELSGYCPECERFTVWKWVDDDIFSCKNCRLQAYVDQVARWSMEAYFEVEKEEDDQEQ